MIWFGWVVQKGVLWIVSCVVNVFFGLSLMPVFGAATTILNEFTPKRSSSDVAINNFLRNISSCTGRVVHSRSLMLRARAGCAPWSRCLAG